MGKSYYVEGMQDNLAVYFTNEYFDIEADGTKDVSDEFQRAINLVVERYGYGILFVPQGKYLFSHTIYIPKAVRVIGYGIGRPTFILKDNAYNFNKPLEDDKGHFRYLFWFVDKVVTKETIINENDANPGTFYSAMNNVNINLGIGNDYAVAFRTHYAQHSFLAHIDINVMSGMAGIYDVGNEMEDIHIKGGQYGIITTKCSPGWPFVMIDTVFEKQTRAAIKTHEAGLTIIRCKASDVPKFIEVDNDYFEKIYIEDSAFFNMNILMDFSLDKNSLNQICVKNTYITNINIIAQYRETNKTENNDYEQAIINNYLHGIFVADLNNKGLFIDEIDISEKEFDETVLQSDLKILPPMNTWKNVKDLGIKGDGITDDTDALCNAISMYSTLYFPQGEYLLSDTITLKEDTVLVGMNPISTKLILKDNSEKFTEYGEGIPFVDTLNDSNCIVFGLGIETGGKNPRAIGLRWNGNKDSYINDVKLFGGHGDLVKGTGEFDMPYNETRTADVNPEKIWDYQYPSIVVHGGGVFKDVWSASPYATAGIMIENTDVSGKVYCMSLEHHCRYELLMKNVKNWTFYGLQTEEEVAEGEFARPIEMHNCENITFNMIYHFRTVFVNKPYDYCVKTFNCRDINFYNVHNFSQMKYTIDNYLLDVNSNTEIREWQATQIHISGLKKREKEPLKYSGFRFPDSGICDNYGNFYFVDSLDKKVYKIDKATNDLSLVFESPYKVNSVGFDTANNIIIVGEYVIPVGATKNGILQENILPQDSYGTSYGYWYNKDAMTIVFTLNDCGKMLPLDIVDIGTIQPEKVLYPGNRWRDGSDFKEVLSFNPKKAWVAPDEKTIIPMHYDLIRANNLAQAFVGGELYSVDEMYKRVFKSRVNKDGLLTDSEVVIDKGDFCVRKTEESIYVGAENIEIYNNKLLQKKTISFQTRPSTFDISEDTLYATARDGIYIKKIKEN